VLAAFSRLGNEGVSRADLAFLHAATILIGIILYTLRKKSLLGSKIKGGKYIEAFLLIIILVFFALSILSGSWHENPLVFSVAPAWVLLTYAHLFFAKVKLTA